jgi:NADH:ubiquinone oxidoreductase subunit E
MQRNQLRPMLQEMFPRQRTYLLPALHYLQHQFGYLPEWALQVVGWHLRIPASEVYGAATSYSELRITEPARYLARVCTGLSCWHGGGRELLEALRAQLDAGPGQFTLEETPCGFLCPLAPVVEIDGRWQGRVTREGLARQVSELPKQAAGDGGVSAT